MIELRVHGRGGQGNVTLAELIAMSAFYDGKSSQTFPMFGVERKGAPVVAFVKIDNKFIRSREQIYGPDFIIIQDPGLLKAAEPLAGAKRNTVVLINSSKLPAKACPNYTGKAYCVPALDIALKTIGKPIINTAMLGAFVKISGLIKLKSAIKAIQKKLEEKYGKEIIDKNYLAFEAAYKATKK